MSTLGVIGNISIDTARYPGRQPYELLGGAALHVALAASQAGLTSCPIAVIGDDLAHLLADPRLDGLDLRRVLAVVGRTCRFDFSYDPGGRVIAVDCDYGVAEVLTGHATAVVNGWEFDHWHIACRRPLDVTHLLGRMVATELPFSVDFHLASAAEQITAAAAALPHASVVFVNNAEHQILCRIVDPETLTAIVVSDGPREAILWRRGKPTASAMPPKVTAREVTGAGDTLAGTFLGLTTLGASDHDALTAAVAAASRRTASPGLPLHPRA